MNITPNKKAITGYMTRFDIRVNASKFRERFNGFSRAQIHSNRNVSDGVKKLTIDRNNNSDAPIKIQKAINRSLKINIALP